MSEDVRVCTVQDKTSKTQFKKVKKNARHITFSISRFVSKRVKGLTLIYFYKLNQVFKCVLEFCVNYI